jgi:hypothetical protein
MIQIDNTAVSGWEAAVRGMRNPHNSWDKSDSIFNAGFGSDGFIVGDKDLDPMKKLVKAGTDHSKFMRMITVTCDITAPLYWWKEMDTYKVGTVRNSCSTMHTITDRQFAKDDFSCEYAQDFTVFGEVLHALNRLRELYIKSHDKAYWYALIQLLPSSYNQRATWSANYQVLRNIYHARKGHKLDEWRDFRHWVDTLPYSELITL